MPQKIACLIRLDCILWACFVGIAPAAAAAATAPVPPAAATPVQRAAPMERPLPAESVRGRGPLRRTRKIDVTPVINRHDAANLACKQLTNEAEDSLGLSLFYSDCLSGAAVSPRPSSSSTNEQGRRYQTWRVRVRNLHGKDFACWVQFAWHLQYYQERPYSRWKDLGVKDPRTVRCSLPDPSQCLDIAWDAPETVCIETGSGQ